MGGSRRRLKKNAPKVKVGTGAAKRKRTQKSIVPLEVLAEDNQSGVSKRLKQTVNWVGEKNLVDNYKANRLVLDPNEGFGRNKVSGPLRTAEEREQAGEEHYDRDDELLAGCNLERSTGKAPPPRLTPRQKQVLEKLIEVHGEDCEAMVLDTKLNKMQHSAGQLKKLIAGLRYWDRGTGGNTRHDFRAPRKQPRHIRI